MRIFIYVQPDMKDTVWVRMSQKAIAAEILRKRYTAVYLQGSSITEVDLESIFAKEEKRVLLYIGTSLKKTAGELRYLAEHHVHTVRLHCSGSAFPASCSYVLLNYHDAVQKAIDYLTANGRDRIALFGVNPCSPTDKDIEKRFSKHLRLRGGSPKRDIYYNYASLQDCYSHFANYRTAYNAAICVNDIAAHTLLHRLRADGVRVPEDMYIVSCGLTSLIADRNTNSITTVSADRGEIGTQAVLAYTILRKNPCDIALTLQVAAKLTVRASTAYAPVPEDGTLVQGNASVASVDFFADPITQSFYNMENLLSHCDELDHSILTRLLAGDTYPKIAEQLFTSGNMISYRVNRMCRLAGCNGKNELVALVKPYLE